MPISAQGEGFLIYFLILEVGTKLFRSSNSDYVREVLIIIPFIVWCSWVDLGCSFSATLTMY